jgi:hypothetical protein
MTPADVVIDLRSGMTIGMSALSAGLPRAHKKIQ